MTAAKHHDQELRRLRATLRNVVIAMRCANDAIVDLSAQCQPDASDRVAQIAAAAMLTISTACAHAEIALVPPLSPAAAELAAA